HAGRPRRPAGAEAEGVLPDKTRSTRDGPVDERVRERLCLLDVVRGGRVRERREARERMKLEALVWEPAVDDAFTVADVDCRVRDSMRLEVLEVLLQLREGRERARRRQRVPQVRQLQELGRDHPRAQLRK